MNSIEIYTKNYCAYCARAKAQLNQMGLSFTEYDVTFDVSKEAEMNRRSKRYTVPQIFIDNRSIGGSDELAELIENEHILDFLKTSSNYLYNQEVANHA